MRNIDPNGGTLQALGFRHRLRLREGVRVLDIPEARAWNALRDGQKPARWTDGEEENAINEGTIIIDHRGHQFSLEAGSIFTLMLRLRRNDQLAFVSKQRFKK